MQTNRTRILGTFALLSVAAPVFAQSTSSIEVAREFSLLVKYELGDTEFAPGDSITIRELRGTSNVIASGETYCVAGEYTLASRAEADLSFFATTTSESPSPIDPKQTTRIQKGSGSFRLIKTMTTDGFLHLTFYSRSSGSGFGGVYFGQGQWVLRDKHFSYLDDASHPMAASSSTGRTSSAHGMSASARNQVLFDYLGNPVEPPSNMDPAYSREGLMAAIQSAAQNAGTSLKKIEIDDSEFPFLIGVISQPSELKKLKEQVLLMKAYEYGGSVGGDTCAAMNIIPHRAFPPQTEQRIWRRLMLREAVLYDRINAQP